MNQHFWVEINKNNCYQDATLWVELEILVKMMKTSPYFRHFLIINKRVEIIFIEIKLLSLNIVGFNELYRVFEWMLSTLLKII